MILENQSHEVKDVESAAHSLETTLSLTPPSYDSEQPPPIYDPTVPLLSKRLGKRRHGKPFVCWLIASLIVFAIFVNILSTPKFKL
jgi:hypothetical protein